MVQAVDINYIAVVIAAIIQMAIGYLWYSPVLFAKQWMGYIGKTEAEIEKTAHNSMYALMMISSLLTAFVLAHFVAYTESTTFFEGMQTGFWLWLGFIVTTHSSYVIFEGRPRGLYAINIGYYLVSFMLMGALLAIW